MSTTASTLWPNIGQQTFDGLGRQTTVTTGNRTTHYHYLPDQLPPCANTLANGQRVDFTYVAELDNQVAQIHPAGEAAHRFSYDPALAMLRGSEGPLGQQTMTYTAGGHPSTDTWKVDGVEHVTTWRHSLNGQLLGYEDAGKVDHQRRFDAVGRLCRIEVGDICCDITYDGFSRPSTYTTHNVSTGHQLVQTLSYDVLGRECRRQFDATLDGKTQTQVQTLTYTDLDQVRTRHWQDETCNGLETFAYDVLGRLRTYTADSAIAPLDAFGNRIVEQCFTLNPLDGYDTVVTTFEDGTRDEASYTYSDTDPCQVECIAHTHPTWPAQIRLEYDACGRVVRDSLGRVLTWDAQDRVTRVDYQGQRCDYGYDPSGNLCDRVVDGTLARGFFSAGQLTHEQRGETTLRPVGDAGQLLALDRLKADVRQGTATLLGCDAQGSVRVEADQTIRSRRYTAHGGEQDVPVATDLSFGFAGERREPLTGWYIPAGYRPYDPLLMIFLAPDSLSPFGRGGLNAYAYCAGDPVNRIDPDGHSWLTWLVAGVGLALGVVATVASFGAAAPAFAAVYAGGLSALTASGAMAMGAATLSAISLGTGVASTLLETMDRDSKTANVLGWISLGTGLLGTGLEMAPKGIRLLAKTGRSVGRALNRNTYTYTPMFVDGSITLSSKNKHAGFIKNLHKTPMPAYRNHSNKAMGTVRNLDDVPRSPAELAEDLAPLLRDTPMDIPLVLISCEAGSTGYAQRLANSLNRPVFGYDEVVYIPPPQQMAKPLKSKLPRGEKNWLQNRVIRKTSNPDYGGWRQAYPRLFTPVGWDMPVDPKWLRHLRS